MFTRLLGAAAASVALTLTASAGIQAVSITGGSLVEGSSGLSGTATLGGGTGTLTSLGGATISSRRASATDSPSNGIYLTGDNTTGSTLAILIEDYVSPPQEIKNLSTSVTVQSSLESGDTKFLSNTESLVYDPNNSSSLLGEYSAGTIGYFGLRWFNGANYFFGYGSLTAIDTGAAGTGLTFGNTVYFEDQADTGIQIGSTPPSTGGDVPEPTGFAILGLIALGAGLKRSRRS